MTKLYRLSYIQLTLWSGHTHTFNDIFIKAGLGDSIDMSNTTDFRRLFYVEKDKIYKIKVGKIIEGNGGALKYNLGIGKKIIFEVEN